MEVKVVGVTRVGSFGATITCTDDDAVLTVDGRAYGPADVHPVYGHLDCARLSPAGGDAPHRVAECIHQFYQSLHHG